MFVATVPDGADLILNKIRGIHHGGGLQVQGGSDAFHAMERFVRLLEEGSGNAGRTPDDLFQGITMASPARTLRRAAIVFAGRNPTAEEVDSVSGTDEGSLRAAIRKVMHGEGFHEFLIRAANDRLLTDRHLESVIDASLETYLVDLANQNRAMSAEAVARGSADPADDPKYSTWESAVQFGLARSPLELIAHVVENDLPYTEILTGDYAMANPMVAEAFGQPQQSAEPSEARNFSPSRILQYYRTDDSKVTDHDSDLGTIVLDAGNLWTEYPHAGILNTYAFLKRYPTTATNRNRARARWTYLHFLGTDIEGLARRAIPSSALADTDNPTLKNAACTSCHSVLDPVAGLFQNYAEEGAYKSNFGGIDSLAETYKFPSGGRASLYQEGDTWYRDMAEPGFDRRRPPDADSSLQWLAAQIASDERFARATVKFWWPAITGTEIGAVPEGGNGPESEGMALAASAQGAEIKRLAAAFRTGIAGGQPFNARDLFVEIALSPWFRAESMADTDPVRDAALRHAGAERLLTPEELARKTESITGYNWGRRLSGFVHEVANLDGEGTDRGGEFEQLYGGIDSNGVFNRSREITPLMASVAQAHAIQVSCAVVMREFYMWPERRRRLFNGIGPHVTPASAAPASSGALSGEERIRRKLADLHWKLLGSRQAPDSTDVEAAYRLFVDVWQRKRSAESPHFDDGNTLCPIDDVSYFDGVLDDVVVTDEWGESGIDWDRVEASWNFEMDDPSHAVRTWVVVLAYLMSDYRYLHL